MSLSMLLLEAIDLETLIAEIYRLAAELAPDENMTRELTLLSGEELGHASLLRSARNYQLGAPEAFGEASLSKEDLLKGLKSAQELLARIEKKQLLLSQVLERLMELEGQFEKAHLQTLVEIHDVSLKKLFERLAGEDREHLKRLSRLLELF